MSDTLLTPYVVTDGPYAGRTAQGWTNPYKGRVALWLDEGHPHPSALIVAADAVRRLEAER